MNNLSAEKALIFRITHVENVSWILRNGLHCASSATSDPNYIQIGNADLIARRTTRAVTIQPYGTLDDYIPFYFTPFSPMLFNIKTGYNGVTKRSMSEIAILVSTLREVHKHKIPFVFTDRHAYLQAAFFYDDLDKLDKIDWPILQARDFRRDPEDPGKVERYQAEALIHQHLPLSALLGIICYRDNERRKIEEDCGILRITKKILCQPGWYV